MKKAAVPEPAMPKAAGPRLVPTDEESPETEALPVRVVKIGSCPTLSGRSTLTYEIGSDPNSACLIRLSENSGGGIFNTDWIDMGVINALLEKHPGDKPVTSYLLSPLYRGKSSNSPAFLFAVLKAEGFVNLTSEKPRLYHKGNAAAFLAEVVALMASDTDLSKDSPSLPETPRKGASRKKGGCTLA